MLSPSEGQIAHALLTRSPLRIIANSPFDLHVLGTPPAFVLSQDQTLHKIYEKSDLLNFFASMFANCLQIQQAAFALVCFWLVV